MCMSCFLPVSSSVCLSLCMFCLSLFVCLCVFLFLSTSASLSLCSTAAPYHPHLCCPAAMLCHCLVVLLSFCAAALLSCFPPALLSLYPHVLLPCCPSVLQFCFLSSLLSFCPCCLAVFVSYVAVLLFHCHRALPRSFLHSLFF